MKRSLTLELVCFRVKGSVIVNHWGGGGGEVGMQPIDIPLDAIDTFTFNDGGFGVESIDYGNGIQIYGVYKHPMFSPEFEAIEEHLFECSEDDVIQVLHTLYNELEA